MSEQNPKIHEGWKLNPEWDNAEYDLVFEDGYIFGFLRKHKTIPILHVRESQQIKPEELAILKEKGLL